MFVLGIDPGVSHCGASVLERRADGRVTAHLIEVLHTDPSLALAVRLAELQRGLVALLDEHRPQVVAIERVLFQVNVQTAMSVGQASGIAMAEAAARGIPVVEYSPNQVKSAVAGYGGASKAQVQKMVQLLLRLPAPPRWADAADAAAVGLCHLAHAAPPRPAAARGSRR